MASSAQEVEDIVKMVEDFATERATESVRNFINEQLAASHIGEWRRKKYLDSLQLSYNVQSKSLEFKFTDSKAEEIEKGVPAIDLKKKFATSSKRKETLSTAAGETKGGWYVDIPFYFASSSEMAAFKSGALNVGRNLFYQAREDTEAAMLKLPNALKERLRADKDTKKGPATPGTDVKLRQEHRVGLLADVMLQPKASTVMGGLTIDNHKGQRQVGRDLGPMQFNTIRRLSSESPAESWWVPAQPGLNLEDAAQRLFYDVASGIINGVMT